MAKTPTIDHEELVARLVKHLSRREGLNRLTWTNLSFLDDQRPEHKHYRRPDVLACVKTLNPRWLAPTVYEVKVTRPDFMADTRSGKWQAHLRYSSRMYFVTPANLVSPKEVPDGVGLLEHGLDDWTWRFRRRATTRQWHLTEADYLRLILGRWGTVPEAPSAWTAPATWTASSTNLPEHLYGRRVV